MRLPPRWRYAGYQAPFAVYTDNKLVVSMQLIQPRAGEVTKHCAISRVDGSRPSVLQVDRVREDFYSTTKALAPIEENNQILATPETVRNLWQKVNVSVITGDLMTPEMVARTQKAGHA